MKPDKAADCALMSDLIRELVFTYFRLRAAGDQLAIRYGQSTGKWGMMRSLREGGPQSVSQIARSRPVARQGVQRMANELARDGLIEFVDNPTHQRAKLMKLTRKGEKIPWDTVSVLQPLRGARSKCSRGRHGPNLGNIYLHAYLYAARDEYCHIRSLWTGAGHGRGSALPV